MIEKSIYSPDAKSHDWDFTLSAKRERLLGKGSVQTSAAAPGFRGAALVKALEYKIVTSLRRIVG